MVKSSPPLTVNPTMLTEAISQLSIFTGLTCDQLNLLEPILLRSDCQVDDVIFEQGLVADYLYIIVSGEVAIIFKPDDGGPITVARLQNGRCFWLVCRLWKRDLHIRCSLHGGHTTAQSEGR